MRPRIREHIRPWDTSALLLSVPSLALSEEKSRTKPSLCLKAKDTSHPGKRKKWTKKYPLCITFASTDGVVLALLVDGGKGEKDDGAGVTGAGERGLS
jgi:hypothetical protein